MQIGDMVRADHPIGASVAKSSWIVKLPSGNYQARHRLRDGTTRGQTFDKKGDAVDWLASVTVDQGAGVYVDPRLGARTFREWADTFMAGSVHLKASTRSRDTSTLKCRLLPQFGDRALGEITQPEVRSWVAAMDAEDIAPGTVVKTYQIFCKIMSGAVDAGLLARSPARGIKLPTVEVHEMRIATIDEIHGIAESINPLYSALVLAAGYGGFRMGELVALRQGRIDFLRSRIEVAENAPEVDGHLVFGSPKSKAGRRTVDMPRSVVEALGEHIARYGNGPDPDALVFGAERGGPLRPRNFRTRFWMPALDAVGMTGLRFHDLRHTAVSLWIEDGANAKLVAVRAGHRSVAVVLDRYGHLYPDAAEGLVSRLEDRFKAANPKPRTEAG